VGSLLVITGPPGAGKSTVARLIAGAAERSVLVEGDAFFGFLATGAIEPWLPASNDQNTVVTRAAASAAGQFATGGFTTVYDGVVGPWFLPTFAAATGHHRLDYVILLPSVELCVGRVATRTDHGFTDEARRERCTRSSPVRTSATPMFSVTRQKTSTKSPRSCWQQRTAASLCTCFIDFAPAPQRRINMVLDRYGHLLPDSDSF
jgi:predicted ABC-type ATPase